MGIPDYQTIMLPLLKFLKDNREHHIREAINHISDEFKLSEDERGEILPSGQQPIIDNRVGWARTYMKKAGLVETPRRGYAKITERGLQVLRENPPTIDNAFLAQFPEFIEFRTKSQEPPLSDATAREEILSQTPDELMEQGYDSIRAALVQELLDNIRGLSPAFFERTVLRLLEGMGYGKGEVTGSSGDGGIDGYINQDKLGLDQIYFQAKRYAADNTVTSRELRDFIGSLEIKGVDKGVFITTSRFPRDAQGNVSRARKSIVLIDGDKLSQLLVDYNIGVYIDKSYEIKRIDSDFFTEE